MRKPWVNLAAIVFCSLAAVVTAGVVRYLNLTFVVLNVLCVAVWLAIPAVREDR